MPSPLDTRPSAVLPDTSFRSWTARLTAAFAGLLLLTLFGLSLQAPASEAATASPREGGIGVPGKPQVKGVVCVTDCVGRRKATPGSRVRVVGVYLDGVSKVAFAAADGVVETEFRKRGYNFVTTTVPKRAAIGRSYRVWVETKGGLRSNRLRRGLEVLDPDRIPVEVFPILGRYNPFSDNFGEDRGTHRHQGVDISADCGRPLVSVRRAVVEIRGTDRFEPAGYHVVLRNVGTNTRFVYMHLLKPAPVRVGDRVGAGQRIGSVGNTGRSRGCHLHFEYWKGPAWRGQLKNPYRLLKDLEKK